MPNHLITVATMASESHRKIGKTRAYEALLDLIDLQKDDDNLKLLSELYKYFKPSKNKKPKTETEWLALALADKKNVRPQLRFFHVENGTIYATDGHRVHYAKTELKNGYYNSELVPIECDFPYPNAALVIETARDNQWYDNVTKELIPSLKLGGDERVKADSVHLNPGYLSDALVLTGSKCHAGNNPEKLKNSAVHFNFGSGRGAIVTPN